MDALFNPTPNTPHCMLCGAPEHLRHPRSQNTPDDSTFPLLLPVHDPIFNLEAACLELLLLQEHLIDPQKRCPECILKHFLAIEALLREVRSLDESRLYADDATALSSATRGIRERWRLGQNYTGERNARLNRWHQTHHEAGQSVRRIRKHLVPLCLPLGRNAPRGAGS